MARSLETGALGKVRENIYPSKLHAPGSMLNFQSIGPASWFGINRENTLQSFDKTMPHIVTYHLHEDIIEKIADYVVAKVRHEGISDFSRIGLVFGGKRPSLFVRRALARRLKSSFFPPRYFTIDSFVDYVLYRPSKPAMISELNAAYCIYGIAKKCAPDLVQAMPRFSDFLPLAEEIVRFIDQLDCENISSDRLASVEAHAQIGYPIPESLNALLRQIVTIRTEYHAVLKRRNQLTRGLRYLAAVEKIPSVSFDDFDEILFCNFVSLSETQKKIVLSVDDKKKAVFFFQGDACEWQTLREISSLLDAPIVPSNQTVCPKPTMTLYGGSDVHAQVSLVEKIMRTHEDFDPHDAVIVLPRADTVIPLLSVIGSLCEECNVSMGYPLRRSTLYSLFEHIATAQNSRKDGRYYAKDYLQVMRHPIIKNVRSSYDEAYTRVVVHKIEEVLLGIDDTPFSGALFITIDEICNSALLVDGIHARIVSMGLDPIDPTEISAVIRMIHEIAFLQWEKVARFFDFSLTVESFLNILVEKSTLGKYPLNLSIVKRIFAFIDEVKSADYRDECFEQQELFAIFTQQLARMKISFSGAPLKGLQVLGRLETRSLSFRTVIILDMNEGVIPDIRRYLPLIPRELLLQVGISLLDNEEDLQRYHFRRLIAGARDVHLIYDDRPDVEKSRYIEELIWEKQKNEGALSSLPTIKGGFSLGETMRESVIEKQPAILSFLQNDFVFSASSLNTYMMCPLRFYYHYVLRLKEKETFADEPQAADIGDFIHRLLEDAFTPFLGKMPVLDEAFEKKFFADFEVAFKQSFEKKMKSDAFTVKEVMLYRLTRFLQFERERIERTGVCEIVGLEKAYRKSIPCGNYRIQFAAFVDRIDRCRDGKLLIIDYKTGNTATTPASLQKMETADLTDRQEIKKSIKSFQLPLYLYCVKQESPDVPTDAALYYLKQLSFDMYSAKIGDAFPFTQSLHYCMGALESLIAELFDPLMPFCKDDSQPTHCAYCPFRSMCV